jgi:hydrogenase maturation protease
LNGDFGNELRRGLTGRVCLVGVGNEDLGDDGFGPRLAQALSGAGGLEVVVAGTTPERWVGHLAAAGFDNIVFLDAVDVAGPPGAVVFMDADELEAALPQISTHKFSLGTLARLIRLQSPARVWLLGVQPASLQQGAGMTPTMTASLDALRSLICETRSQRPVGQTGSPMS